MKMLQKLVRWEYRECPCPIRIQWTLNIWVVVHTVTEAISSSLSLEAGLVALAGLQAGTGGCLGGGGGDSGAYLSCSAWQPTLPTSLRPIEEATATCLNCLHFFLGALSSGRL